MSLPTLRFEATEPELRRIGLRAVSIIRERTLRGIDGDGKPFAPYSTTPFGMPAGAVPKGVRAKLKGSLEYRRSKKGTLWAIFTGGYKAYKAARYGGDGGTVNISATGATMRALTVLGVETGPATGPNQVVGSIRIGFTRTQAAEIISYLQLTGVGKRRVLRKIMELTSEERAELAAMAVQAIRVTM